MCNDAGCMCYDPPCERCVELEYELANSRRLYAEMRHECERLTAEVEV